MYLWWSVTRLCDGGDRLTGRTEPYLAPWQTNWDIVAITKPTAGAAAAVTAGWTFYLHNDSRELHSKDSMIEKSVAYTLLSKIEEMCGYVCSYYHDQKATMGMSCYNLFYWDRNKKWEGWAKAQFVCFSNSNGWSLWSPAWMRPVNRT